MEGRVRVFCVGLDIPSFRVARCERGKGACVVYGMQSTIDIKRRLCHVE
jgi:hypothetical protein